MSSLFASSHRIEIQSNGFGVVTIRNATSNAGSATYPILFKVKTNLRDVVDVRPSFGVIWSQNDKSIVPLNIKYTGSAQQIDKAKLMITWFSTEEKKQFENRKFSHDQFSNYFNTAKKINEGSLLLPIVYKEQAEKQRVQQNKSEFAQSNQSEETIPTNLGSSKHEKVEQRDIFESNKGTQSKFQSLSSQLSQKNAKKSEKPSKPEKPEKMDKKSGCSILQIFAFFVTFLVGVSVGMKIERFTQPFNNFTLSSLFNNPDAPVQPEVVIKVEQPIKESKQPEEIVVASQAAPQASQGLHEKRFIESGLQETSQVVQIIDM